MPTKSSSRSGPIGWSAPSDMQASTSSALEAEVVDQPHRVEQVREEQPVDDEAGLVGDLDRALAERLAEGAGAVGNAVAGPHRAGRAPPAPSACTGLKTWKPKTRSAMPAPPSPSSADRSDEVVVARSASGQTSPSVESNSAFASRSSTIASTTRSQPARSAGLGRHPDPIGVAALDLAAEPLRPAPRPATPTRRCGPAPGPRRAPTRRRRGRARSLRCRPPPGSGSRSVRSLRGSYPRSLRVIGGTVVDARPPACERRTASQMRSSR